MTGIVLDARPWIILAALAPRDSSRERTFTCLYSQPYALGSEDSVTEVAPRGPVRERSRRKTRNENGGFPRRKAAEGIR